MSGVVRLSVDGAVATLTIDAPEVKNALSPAMAREFVALCDEIEANATIGAAIVVGAGGTFCSGADRRVFTPQLGQSGIDEEVLERSMATYASFLRLSELALPTIAAVRGVAVGAGVNLMLAADLRIVSEDARILSGFVRIGIHPGGGFFTLASRLAGREAAAALGLFGEEISGARAAALGLAWEAVPDEQVEARAREIAERVARDPGLVRKVAETLHKELGPPQIPLAVASEFERMAQMWSRVRRRDR